MRAMNTPSFKHKLKEGQTLVGSFVFSTDPSIDEIYASAGYDFVVIDMEHGLNDVGGAVAHIRAARGAGIHSLVRVGEANFSNVPRLLDAGCDGIKIPHFGVPGLGTDRVLANMRYSPVGERTACTSVYTADFGLEDFAASAEWSNREVLSMGLVEDIWTLENIDKVLEETPPDCISPGPSDLSTSLGVPGQFRHPKVIEAIQHIKAAADKRAIPMGMYVTRPSEIPEWRALGMQFFIISTDLKILADSVKRICLEAREHVAA